MCVCMLSHFSHVWLCVTLWIIAHQAPLSMGFSRQEYGSGLLCPPPGDLPDLGIEPRASTLQAEFFTTEPPGKPHGCYIVWQREFCRCELDWGSWDGEIVQDYPSGPSVLPRILLKGKGMWRWKWGKLRFKDPVILALKLEERSISQEMQEIQF